MSASIQLTHRMQVCFPCSKLQENIFSISKTYLILRGLDRGLWKSNAIRDPLFQDIAQRFPLDVFSSNSKQITLQIPVEIIKFLSKTI